MLQNVVFDCVLTGKPVSHVTKDLICEVDLVILADNDAFILAIKDFLVKLRRSIDLNHFGEALSLVYVDVVQRCLQVNVEQDDHLAN